MSLSRLVLVLVSVGCAGSGLHQVNPGEGSFAGRSVEGLLISEVVDRSDQGKFIELCNRSSQPVSLQDLMLTKNSNGGPHQVSFDLPAVDLLPGQTFVAAERVFSDIPADVIHPVASGNGNDAYVLHRPDGTVLDSFGEFGVDGSNTAWNYRDQGFVRADHVSRAQPEFAQQEWVSFHESEATPGVCSRPGSPLVLNEVADVPGSDGFKYVSICNLSGSTVELGETELQVFVNGNGTPRVVELEGALEPGEAFVVVGTSDAENFGQVHGAPDAFHGYVSGNGDDAYGLSVEGELVDVLGVPGTDDNESWDYTDRIARRLGGVASNRWDPDHGALGVDEGAPFDCGVSIPEVPESVDVVDARDCTSGATLSGGSLRAHVRSLKDITCSYDSARSFMYDGLDDVDGVVQCAYTHEDSTSTGMNTEHVWPQSQGAGSGRARCDLNHLLPTDTQTNSVRSSYPMGDVVDIEWSRDDARKGRDASGQRVFEPPDEVKGNVARALLYMHSAYGFNMSSSYKERMKQWSAQDPVDAVELERTRAIADFQGSGNPLVECPTWIERL